MTRRDDSMELTEDKKVSTNMKSVIATIAFVASVGWFVAVSWTKLDNKVDTHTTQLSEVNDLTLEIRKTVISDHELLISMKATVEAQTRLLDYIIATKRGEHMASIVTPPIATVASNP